MNNYTVCKKEPLYFWIKAIFSVLIYIGLFIALIETADIIEPKDIILRNVLIFYTLFFIVYFIFLFGIYIGYIKGNGIKVTPNQFGNIYKIVTKQAELLGLNAVPDVYILQSGGIINAFASSFFGSNYVILYSETVQAALEEDPNVIAFIIGHELGHIKRHHMLKKLLLLPAIFIPFLGAAYSRACEYTCDSIGHALAPEGATNGILLLAGGRKLFAKINVQEFIKQGYSEDGFWKWIAEKLASHPNLTKRIQEFHVHETVPTIKAPISEIKPIVTNEDDLTKFMPK